MTKDKMIRRVLDKYEDGILEIQHEHDKRIRGRAPLADDSFDSPIIEENMRYCEELNKLQNEILAEIMGIAGEGSKDV